MRMPLLALALTIPPVAAQAAPTAVGVWMSPTDHAQIDISACGPALCGKVVSSGQITADPDIKDSRNKDASLRSRKLRGLTILKDFTGGPKVWKGGTVYDPKSGKVYSGSLTLLSADALKLTGCVVAPFCQSETWTRAH